jgi:hypothetical protein
MKAVVGSTDVLNPPSIENMKKIKERIFKIILTNRMSFRDIQFSEYL